MPVPITDLVAISDARARLAELAEEVARDGTEKLLTRNGVALAALIDAKRLEYYHALEAERAELDQIVDAQRALEDVIAGKTLTPEELRRRLAAPESAET